MRSEDKSFSYPDTKEDCSKINSCKHCGLLVDYLLEDNTFTCFCPMKSMKILRGVFNNDF